MNKMCERWIQDGPVLIMVPLQCVKHWHGVESDDYEKVCDLFLEQWLTLFQIANAPALLLGGDPEPATVEYEADSIVVIRWVYASDQEALISFAKRGDDIDIVSREPEIKFQNNTAEWVLMNAAIPGRNAEESWLPFIMPIGKVVASTNYLKAPINSAIVHRFRTTGVSNS